MVVVPRGVTKAGSARIFIKKGIDLNPAAALEAALPESPRCPQAYNVLAQWAARSGDYEKAIDLYGRALEVEPAHARSAVYLADTLIGLGRFEEGFAAYRRAMQHKTRRDRVDPYLTISFAWRLATCPTIRSSALTATTEGNNRPPSALVMTVGSPPIITAQTELVVPRSMPIILLIYVTPVGF